MDILGARRVNLSRVSQVKLECLRLLARLKLNPARSKLIGGFMDSYLNLTAQEMKLFEREREKLLPKEKEETVALISRWESRGIEQGLHDGKEQLIVHLISRRLGNIPPAVTGRISALTPAQMDDLGEALLDFTGPEDLDRWLSLH